MSFAKTNEATEKVTGLSEPEAAASPVENTEWTSLVWLTLLVALGLTAFERLKHLLFPQLNSFQNQAVTVCVGTIIAVIGSYYLNRKLDWACPLE